MYVSFLKMNVGEILLKKPITGRTFLRAVKPLVMVTLSESFRIRPRLPFQANLGIAKTEVWLGFANEEVRPNPARVVGTMHGMQQAASVPRGACLFLKKN